MRRHRRPRWPDQWANRAVRIGSLRTKTYSNVSIYRPRSLDDDVEQGVRSSGLNK